MNLTHDAPHLTVSEETLRKFLVRCAIVLPADRDFLIPRIAAAFSNFPYENLTKIIKSESVISARSAMRYPDEVIGDWIRWGTGGTCFSLTAAVIAVYNALGIEAHPVLADRHYGTDTHCGMIIVQPNGLLLLDPGYLLFTPTLLPVSESVFIDTPHNRIELKPLEGGTKVELYTIVKNSRKLRLTYKVRLVDASAFARAWEQSFAWEMMTYPVLTRSSGTAHHYLQGDTLSTRTAHKTIRSVLTPEQKATFIAGTLGIDTSIVNRALEIVSHGANKPTHSG